MIQILKQLPTSYKTAILLGLLIVAGAALRFFRLGEVPSILNRDEAALAYNAYLLLETGKDEWGRSWPVALESFGDFKLPGYVVLLTGLFSFLPLTDTVVRLPAMLAGSLLILIAYAWSTIFYKERQVQLLVAAITAVTPIYFFYSRIAYEALVGLTLALAGWFLFFKTFQKRVHSILALFAGTLLLTAAAFTYNTPLLLIPFFSLALILHTGLLEWKQWLAKIAILSALFIVINVILLPLTSQKSGITIFTDETVWNNRIAFRTSLPPVLQPILGNQYLFYSGLVVRNTAQSFLPEFLILEGGSHPWHSLPGYGHLPITVYVLTLVALATCTVFIFKRAQYCRSIKDIASLLSDPYLVLPILLVSSLAASVVTVDAPHTTRSLFFFFWWILLAPIGLIRISKQILARSKKSTLLSPIVLTIAVLLITIESSIYFYRYFTTLPNTILADLFPGFEQAIQEVDQEYPDKEIAIVDGSGFQYVLTAWYLKMNSDTFFESVIRQQPDQIGFKYGQQVGRYHFIGQKKDREKTNEPVVLYWTGDSWKVETF